MTHVFSIERTRNYSLFSEETDDSFFFLHPIFSFVMGALVIPSLMLVSVFTATSLILMPIALVMGWV